MQEPLTPLFVRIHPDSAGRLEQAATSTGRSKRRLVEDAVRAHIDGDGLVVGRVALREEAPEVLTPGEAAALLRIGEPQLLEAAEHGELPGRRIGGEWRFSRDALVAWLADAPAG